MRALHAGVPGSGCQLCKGCQLCTAGTFSPGDTLDPCLPCRFGFSSSPGATSESRCQKVANPCPAGSQAPANATTSQDCMCKPGYGTVADVVVPGESICTQVRLLPPAGLPCPSLPCIINLHTTTAMHSAQRTHTLLVAPLNAALCAALALAADQAPPAAQGFQTHVHLAQSRETPRQPSRVCASLGLVVMQMGSPAASAQ